MTVGMVRVEYEGEYPRDEWALREFAERVAEAVAALDGVERALEVFIAPFDAKDGQTMSLRIRRP